MSLGKKLCYNIGLWSNSQTSFITQYNLNMPVVSCQLCTKEFKAKPSWIKNGYGKYCSRNCSYKGRLNGKEVACTVCATVTYKSQKALNGSRSKKYFCSKSCQTTWRNTEFKGNKHANWQGGRHSYRELLLRSSSSPACTLCRTDDLRILAAHHIDEDRNNNTIENLAWLCHNCHHLVHHDQVEHKKFMAAIV